MIRNPRSLLAGTAVAAVLIFPSLASLSGPMMAWAAPASPPPARSEGNWERLAPRTFDTQNVKVKDVVGKVTVAVGDGGPMVLEVSGDRSRVRAVKASTDDGELVIDGGGSYQPHSVWDWTHWFDFSDASWHDHGNLLVKVTVPKGARVNVDGLVGDANIGDTNGALHFSAVATKAQIGHVGEAHISLAGAGKVNIAGIDGDMHLDVGGSGKVRTGPVHGALHADIAGSGDATFGAIAGGIYLDIAGSGDITAAHINGPAHVEIAGSGNVKVADGTANPLHVEILGAGNFVFGGTAVDPHIEAFGSGTVKLKAYRGNMNSEGMANVQVGGW